MKSLAEKIATLPPWAREHIAALNEKMRVMVEGLPPVPKTRIILDPYAQYNDHGKPTYLPEDKQVRFLIGHDVDEEHTEHWIDVRIEPQMVRGLHCLYLNGGRGLVVIPNGGNTLYVGCTDRW